MPGTLVILRHGQSTWNLENLFTGWHDVPLTAQGESEAAAAGPAAEPAAGVPGQEVPIAPPPPRQQQQQPQPASFSIPGQIPVSGRPRKRRRGVGGFGCLFALVFAAVLVAGPVIALVAFTLSIVFLTITNRKSA